MRIEDEFIVPPECGGQIVERAYKMAEGYVYKRETDRSLPKAEQVKCFRSHPLANDRGDYWNGSPANKRWKQVKCQL